MLFGATGETADMRLDRKQAGFTLVEILLATIVSVMVFSAMGMVLTKSFSLWKDATARWQLSQYARISRERILHGGFADPRGGLLSATNVSVVENSVTYRTVEGSGSTQLTVVSNSLQLAQGSNWVNAAQSVGADSLSSVESVNLLQIIYGLSFSAAGQTFTQSNTITAFLINKD